ncbi:MAG: hypothetical protein HGA87_01260 [Desulfobulbaceae bacterium]|nr:hypothetical protein [Desulfobulbaceae bacterium]
MLTAQTATYCFYIAGSASHAPIAVGKWHPNTSNDQIPHLHLQYKKIFIKKKSLPVREIAAGIMTAVPVAGTDLMYY